MKTTAKKIYKMLRTYLAVLATRKTARSMFHRLILGRKRTDAQILAIVNRATKQKEHKGYPGTTIVSWYRSELGRLGFPMSVRARVTA